MSRVLHSIALHARTQPQSVALRDRTAHLTYAELHQRVQCLAQELRETGASTLALLADNGLSWALIDLAAMSAGLRMVPLPAFFSPQQIRHALRSAGVDALIVDPRFALPDSLATASQTTALRAVPTPLNCVRLFPSVQTTLPIGTQKITYTSGTTGQPKGVCLALDAMETVAQSLADASGAQVGDQHLSLLPLSTLLENIGGLYAPLLVGATACLHGMAEVGIGGATQVQPALMIQALMECNAGSTILVPQLLQALVLSLESSAAKLPALKFIAVGGATVTPRWITRAQKLGLPVFEGYGLSECASVVALNTVQAQRLGSVGKPLPHVQIQFAQDGEILVRGKHHLGYVGEALAAADSLLATGDIGHLDTDGFLYLSGRKKSMFVTSFGRNVAPEWVERELCEEPAIAQAAVFGEARAWNAAVILPRGSKSAVDAALQRVNAQLPDYARVRRWIAADAPFSSRNHQLTANGRLRRADIWAAYGEHIESLYEDITVS